MTQWPAGRADCLENGTGHLKVCTIITAAAALLAGLAMSAAADERLVVYAVNYPVAYFAERIAGDAAVVVLPVASIQMANGTGATVTTSPM